MRVIYRLDTIKERLRPIFESYPIYKAILFGSYARGEATPESDLDIVVDSHGEIRGLEFYGLLDGVVEILNKDVDMFEIKEIRKQSPIYTSIQKEGVIIYERQG